MEGATATSARWSTTALGAASDIGDGAVTAGRLIGAVLDRHKTDYAGGGSYARPEWLVGEGPTQAADDRLADASPLFRGDEMLHGRELILALAVLDERAGRIAFRSGVLWRIATEEKPVTARLSELGKRLLSRRLPALAACLGLRGPDDEPRTGDGPAIDVAFPPDTDPLWGGVGRYAAAWRESSGARVEVVRDGSPVATFSAEAPRLAWWRRDVLVGCPTGLFVQAEDLTRKAQWGDVRAVCATTSNVIAVLGVDGRLRVGELDHEDPRTIADDVVAAAGVPDTPVEEQLAEPRRANERALAEAHAEAESKAAELRVRETEVAQAEAAEASAQTAVEQATPEQVFADYLADRVVSDDYRRHLGILGLVRRDLDVISNAIETHNKALLAGTAPSGQRTINRIVLYVDDLDRCAPEVVVRVLEAVHLLLAYPIFVVVVAIDPEWVSRSLRVAYPALVEGEHVTPEDYLEKIFQLPLWLEPLHEASARDMIAALLGVVKEDAVDPGGNGRPQLEIAAAPQQPSVPTVAAAPHDDADAATARENLAESPPTTLALTEAEEKGIAGLAPLLTRSPRALKRYLNTYRLLKAQTDPEELRTAQLLLALAIQRRASTPSLVEAIAAAEPNTQLGTLVGDDTDPVVQRLLGEYVDPSWRQASCSRWKQLARDVQRFTFGLERSGSKDASRIKPS